MYLYFHRSIGDVAGERVFMQKCQFVVFLYLTHVLVVSCVPVVTPASSEQLAPSSGTGIYEYWEAEFFKLRELGARLESDSEQWEEVLTGIIETSLEPSEVEVISGSIHEFEVAAEIELAFPQRLGGWVQTAPLRGHVTFFVEESADDSTSARIWVYDIREEIEGITFQYDTQQVNLGTFVLDTSMLDLEPFDFDSPQGILDEETGQYNLTYVIRPRHPVLEAASIDAPDIIVNETGTIELYEDSGSLSNVSGTVSIDSGFFEGMNISYADKTGRSNNHTKVLYMELKPFKPECGIYAGTIYEDLGIIAGKGLGPYHVFENGTDILFRDIINWYPPSMQWSDKWNGEPASGAWYMVHHPQSAYPCDGFPPSSPVVLEVEIQSQQ